MALTQDTIRPATGARTASAGDRVAADAGVHRLRTRLVFMHVLGDLVFAYLGLTLSFLLKFWLLRSIGTEPGAETNFLSYQPVISMALFALILSYAYLNIYNWKLLLRPRKMAPMFIKATFLWAVVYLSISVVLKFEPQISRLFMLYSIFTVLGFVGAWKFIYTRLISKSATSRQLTQRIAFVGWTDEASELAGAILSDPQQPYEITGVIRSCHSSEASANPRTDGTFQRILGCFDEIGEVLSGTHRPDILVVADLDLNKEQLAIIARLCELHYVQLKIIPSMFQIFISGLRLETVSGKPLLGIEDMAIHRPINQFMKRMTDIGGALVGLSFSVPLIAILAFMIRRESRGPVFFAQHRIGSDHRIFKMYKLRSMRLGSEQLDHENQSTLRDDPRLLRIGKFMRKWNLDELPQFWNVLKGDMSLVGPRPEREFHVSKLSEEIRHYNQRHLVKPGITGWAQVNGYRGNTSLEERIRYDIYYIENWSFFWDLWIMFLTFFKRENAY